jgi:hypothetical protein
MRIPLVAGCAGVLFLVTGITQAALITYQFSGEVTSVIDYGPHLDGSIAPGTLFSGKYTFESTTPDDYPDVPWARYTFPSLPELTMTLNVGNYDLVAPLASIYVEHASKDAYGVRSHSFTFGPKEATYGFSYFGAPNSTFDSDALPIEPPDITRLTIGGFTFESADQGEDRFTVGGKIISIIPEPNAAALLFIGLLTAYRGRQE